MGESTGGERTTKGLLDAVGERKVSLTAISRFVELATCHDARDLLTKALALIVEVFAADAGSLIYMSEPPVHVRQGEFSEQALQQIALWEKGIEQHLTAASRQIRAPHLPPVTTRDLSSGQATLLNTPLLSSTNVIGSLSLVFGSGQQPGAAQREALLRLVRGIGDMVELIAELSLTRRRLSQLGLFYQVGQALVSTFDLNRLLEDTMQLATSVMDAGASSLMLIDEESSELFFEIARGERGDVVRRQRLGLDEGVAGWVATQGEPAIVNDVSRDPRFSPRVDQRTGFLTRSIACVPLQLKGKTIGVLEVLNKRAEEGFDEEDVQLLQTIAAQAAIAIENARLYQSLREERDRIIKAQEDVRHELARNLHDGTVQILAAMTMSIDHAQGLLDRKPDLVRAELNALRNLARQAMHDARMVLFELRPVILESQGLVPALRFYVEQLRRNEDFAIHFEVGGVVPRMNTRVEGAIFSIVQEAFNNAKKHARAQNVWVQMRSEEGHLVISLRDDGCGFDMSVVERDYAKRGSFGLLNMSERAELIEGHLSIQSPVSDEEKGTIVTLRVPSPQAGTRSSGTV